MRRAHLAIAATGALLVGVVVPTLSSYGEGPFSFPHQPHISDASVEAGLREAIQNAAGNPSKGQGGIVDADCRVCHDFGKGDEVHLGGCDQCHIADKHLTVKQSAAPASGRSAFPHVEHLKDKDVTCFSCHRMQVEEDWVEFTVVPPGLGAKGTEGRPGGPLGEFTCTDCHSTHEPVGGLVTKDEKTGDGQQCGTCHMGASTIVPLEFRPGSPGEGVRPFLHGDHGGAQGVCEDCHTDIRESATIWDYDPTLGTAERCAACHVKDAQGTSLVGVGSPARQSEIAFVDFDKFPHGAHMTASDEIEVSGEVTAGCQTCHYPETDAEASKLFPGRRAGEVEPVGRYELVDYRACQPCHEPWKVIQHGVGAWACFKCHPDDVVDDAGKARMAQASVTRDEITTVTFWRHHHPGVTRNGAPLANPKQEDGKTCATCHIGDIEELSSRLEGKGFQHDPHLAKDPSNSACLACHVTAATTSWSEDLRRFETHVGQSGTVVGAGALAKGCLDCHIGATTAELATAQATRSVSQFDHKAHVSEAQYLDSSTKGIACTECHTPGGEVGYTIPADVADCSRCHSHDEETFPKKYGNTGPASSVGDAKACVFCHEKVFDKGERPVRTTRKRTHLDLLPGKQWHNKGGDCASCHNRDGLQEQRSEYKERITSARVKTSIHDDAALAGEWFNDPRIAEAGGDPAGKGRTCATCHRRDPRGYLRSLGR